MLRNLVHARNRYPQSAVMHGGSIWGKIKSFASGANKFLRRSRLLSTAGAVGSMFIPQLRIPTMAARIAGYGRRRRRTHRMRRMR